MTIWAQVEEALSGLGVPAAANIMLSATGDSLPDLYLVYFLVSSTPELHADNFEVMRGNRIQVTVYNRNGLEGLPDVDQAMVDAGFLRGPARELPYNRETRHFGLALEYVYAQDNSDSISA